MIVKVKGESKKAPARRALMPGRAKPKVKTKNFKFYIVLLPFTFLLFTLPGCGPTYPKGKIEESILKLCKDEYKLDVKVETIGHTIAIYVPLPDLMDFTFAITKSASEKINDVILSVSRVTLSTDAEFNFYCIIAHDVKMPEIQIVIIKSVDDVKRFLLNDISRNEYSKRMIVDLRLNPQSQKERAIKEVFQKMNLDKKWQEEVMNDFFRTEPSSLGEIGYWNDRFYIKDVNLPEFLADQIANRIRIEFKDDKVLADAYSIKSSKAFYNSKSGRAYFRIEILAESKWSGEAAGSMSENKVFGKTLEVASYVVHAYRFDKFHYIEIENLSDNKILRVPRTALEEFRKKKVPIEDLTRGENG